MQIPWQLLGLEEARCKLMSHFLSLSCIWVLSLLVCDSACVCACVCMAGPFLFSKEFCIIWLLPRGLGTAQERGWKQEGEERG